MIMFTLGLLTGVTGTIIAGLIYAVRTNSRQP